MKMNFRNWKSDFCNRCVDLFGEHSEEAKFAHKTQSDKDFHEKIHEIFSDETNPLVVESAEQNNQQDKKSTSTDGWRRFLDFQKLPDPKKNEPKLILQQIEPANQHLQPTAVNRNETFFSFSSMNDRELKKRTEYEEYVDRKCLLRRSLVAKLRARQYSDESAVSLQCQSCLKILKWGTFAVLKISTTSRIENHILTYHMEDKLFGCRTCNRYYKTRTTWRWHVVHAKHDEICLDSRRDYGSILKEQLELCFGHLDRD